MGEAKAKPDWGEVYAAWRMHCEGFYSDVTAGVDFLRVGTSARPGYRHNYSVDWWPKNHVGERRNPRSRPGYVTTWETKAGTLHTASLLREAEGDSERQHAILILASLWDKEKDLPDEWRGRCYRMINDVEAAVRARHPVRRWHHASRDALPLSVIAGGQGETMLVPADEYDLMFITALESVLTHATWQLIDYSDEAPRYMELVH